MHVGVPSFGDLLGGLGTNVLLPTRGFGLRARSAQVWSKTFLEIGNRQLDLGNTFSV